MHHPVVSDSWTKKQSRRFVRFSEQWWVKNLIRPFFFILPPTLIVAIVTKQGLNHQIIDIFGPNIGERLNNSAFVILLGAFSYLALMKFIYAGIEQYSKPDKELSTEDCLAILEALNLVVGDKSKRFSNLLRKQLTLKEISPGATFLEITRPDQQIALLIKGLRSVFEYVDHTNARFRVGLLRIIKGSPTEWVAFEPATHPPRTQPDQLSAPSSTVSAALRTKSIVVIEDIQSELVKKTNKKERRFIRGNTQENEQGSQLCFPINHASTGDIEYVITIAGNKKCSLIENHSELYSWIIENFSTRISLEHSLLAIKEKANAQ